MKKPENGGPVIANCLRPGGGADDRDRCVREIQTTAAMKHKVKFLPPPKPGKGAHVLTVQISGSVRADRDPGAPPAAHGAESEKALRQRLVGLETRVKKADNQQRRE